MESILRKLRIIKAERAVEGAAAKPAKSVVPAILLKSLVLVAAVGSAPHASGQAGPAFTPAAITVRAGEPPLSVVLSNWSGPVTCGVGRLRFFNQGPTRRAEYIPPDNPEVTNTECFVVDDESVRLATLRITFGDDTTAPVLEFDPSEISVDSGATAVSTFTATDNVAITTGPAVTCTQGSYDPDTKTYTAPVVSVDTTATCRARALDFAGNIGEATLTVSIARETTPPVVTFTPGTLTVASGATAASTLTATDNVAVTTGPDVTCDAGSFANNTYTAPAVSADTTATCTATASDAAGNEGTAALMVSITAPPDTTSPVVTFSPDTLTVISGTTASVTLTATDNVGVTTGPDVTCDAGSFANNTYTAPVRGFYTFFTCTATATDAAGNTGRATLRGGV
ncbi:MAG: hypothetical protein GDA35_01005, partial [Hyphomonadaceae bacterium]|nr:hypothetical protein [Hyphomonadaceae bacterium]